MGKHFSVAFVGADNNKWSLIYKITRFAIFIRDGWGFWCKVLNVPGEGDGVIPESNKCEQGRRGGPNFGHFSHFNNLIIECLHI